jgi:predicted nucleic acid-binding protein
VSYLIDTNVLLRSRDADSPIQGICATAIQHLLGSDADLFVCTQVLAEYWVVATRPREVNGMGLSPQAAAREIDEILSAMETLVEPKMGLSAGATSWSATVSLASLRTTPASSH